MIRIRAHSRWIAASGGLAVVIAVALAPTFPAWAAEADPVRETARGRELEARIQAEQARQAELLQRVQQRETLPPEPARAGADLSAAADLRVAPPAPVERELPLEVFDDERTEIAVGAWGNARALEALKLVLDADRDGHPEQIRYYDRQRERLYRIEQDRDYDGRIDQWSSFELGELRSRELDESGDGKVDVAERYRDALMSERRIDRNADGVWDAFYDYDGGLLAEERHDRDDDGRIDLRVEYRGRARVKSEEDTTDDGAFDTWTWYQAAKGEERVARIERASRGAGKPDVTEWYEPGGARAVLARREEDRNRDGVEDITSYYENGKLVRRAFSDAAFLPTGPAAPANP